MQQENWIETIATSCLLLIFFLVKLGKLRLFSIECKEFVIYWIPLGFPWWLSQ